MQCPNCSKEIRNTAKVCGYCGYKLQTEPEKCPQCGNAKRAGAKVCGYCGYRFESVVETPEPEIKQEASLPQKQEEQPIKVEKTEEPSKEKSKPKSHAEPKVKKPKKTKKDKKVKPRTGKRSLAWVWILIGMVVIGGLGSFWYFTSYRLPSLVTNILPGARIVEKENFIVEPKNGFELKSVSFQLGKAILKGNGKEFSSYAAYERNLKVGEAALILFMIDPESKGDPWYWIQLYTMDNNNYYASLGFSEWYHPYYAISNKENGESYFSGSRIPPRKGVWYYALFTITSTKKVTIRVWEKNDPSRLSQYTWQLVPELSWRSWQPAVYANSGTIYLDSITIISFP